MSPPRPSTGLSTLPPHRLQPIVIDEVIDDEDEIEGWTR
jgi:hypothetical protein